MADDDLDEATPTRVRREPPPFRRLEVQRVVELSARMRRIVLGGPELAGFEDPGPASSVRLLLPPAGQDQIVMPTWTGNEFTLPSGERALIRTFTPRHVDLDQLELTIDIVIHDTGAASGWATAAAPGIQTAVSGPGRGYDLEHQAASYLLAGDESAIPAICQLLEVIPATTRVQVHLEISDPSARLELPDHPAAEVSWHLTPAGSSPGGAFAEAIEALDQVPDAVWVAGEAAAVQRVRTHLADVRGRPRSTVTARGYWKRGRATS
jgi:NADPH-dependent ferric siderophore reductase